MLWRQVATCRSEAWQVTNLPPQAKRTNEMVRARSGKTVIRSRKRLKRLTKGFRLSRHNLIRQAEVTLIRARVYAYRDRKARKRDFRRLWIARVNAACRMRGMRYSELI